MCCINIKKYEMKKKEFRESYQNSEKFTNRQYSVKFSMKKIKTEKKKQD